MITLEIELAVIGVLAFAALIAFIVTHRQLVGALYDRQKIMDVHQKAVTRNALDVSNRASAVLDEAVRTREDARVLLERADRFFGDPRVKRILDE